MIPKKKIFLLGDAIVDNFYWLTDRENDLRKELMHLGYDVSNHGAENINVKNILHHVEPPVIHTKTRTYPYLTEKDGKMYPLRSIINKNKSFTSIYDCLKGDKDNMIVLSMGGNDIQSHFLKIVLGPEFLMKSVLSQDFISNFETVIKSCSSVSGKIVLISTYLPYLGPESSYAKYSNISKTLIRLWNDFIRDIARKYNIPVLDLSLTLNPNNRKHYGTDDTRMSNLANTCMAKSIDYIHKNYSGYRVYYAPDCHHETLVME